MEGIFVIAVEATPLPGPDFASVGGAYINVFTISLTEEAALSIAQQNVAEAGWHIDAVDQIAWVTRADYSDNPTGLEYFEQALIDGVVLVIHTYSPESGKPDICH
jgi:hypothetical protein